MIFKDDMNDSELTTSTGLLYITGDRVDLLLQALLISHQGATRSDADVEL